MSTLASLSSLALAPAAALFAYDGFWPECTALLFATLSSLEYHMCMPDAALEWCPDSPEVALAHDMMAAYMALLAVTTCALGAFVGDKWRLRYGIGGSLVTYVLVTLFQDGLPTLVPLATAHTLVLAYACWGRWLVPIGLLAAGAGALRLVSRDLDIPSDAYYLWHALWHLVGGLAALVVAARIRLHRRGYHLVKEKEGIPTGGRT